MSSSLSNVLNKEIPVWHILTAVAVLGVGHLIFHPHCCQCSPQVETISRSHDQPQSTNSSSNKTLNNSDSSSNSPPTKQTLDVDASTIPIISEEEVKSPPPRIEIPPTPTANATNSIGQQVIPAPLSDEETVTEDDWVDFKTDWLFYDGPYPIVDEYTREDGPAKLVLCVNVELKMGKGKIAAQCGHATLGAYKLAKKYCKTGLSNWEKSGTKKIAVKVEEEIEFYDILEKAKLAGVICYIVQDAGKTQIAAGSRTVLALGPAPEHILNQISGHLKLL